MIKRHATSVWNGAGKDGNGHLTTQSGILNSTPYSFNTRFGDVTGTNPEELIAAAHSGCFNMALAFTLNAAGFTAETLTTKATVTLEKDDSGFSVTLVNLALQAKIPNISEEQFQELAEKAKATCPISRLFNTVIMMDASLV